MNQYLEIENDLLVEECIKGNPDALNLFYTRFAPKMLSIVRRYVADPKDAEDILHDGFLVAFTRLNTLRSSESVEYWLASIMKNLSIQFLQAQDLVTILHEIPEVEDSPDFNDIIDLATLESLIQELPKGYQTVFRLSVLEHKTHKEIAKILGIAPNSSSSQLFHAKMMMRRLISEHKRRTGLISILIILFSAGVLWWLHSDSDIARLDEPAYTYIAVPPTDSITERTVTLPVITYLSHNQSVVISAPAVDMKADTVTISVETELEPVAVSEDSTAVTPSDEELRIRLPESPLYADNDNYIFGKPTRKNDWSFKLSTSTSVSPRKGADGDICMSPYPFSKLPVGDSGLSVKPVQETVDMSGLSHDGKMNGQRKINSGNYDYFSHHNDLPVTVAATFNKSVSKVVGIETGIVYTYLHSTYEFGSENSDCRWHYLGIPLQVTFNNYSGKRIRLYATAGVRFDIPLYSCGSISTVESYSVLPDGSFHSSTVWSLTASYGIGLNLTDKMGLFVEPAVQYHFSHDYEVPNTWTENRLSFALPVGIRFNF